MHPRVRQSLLGPRQLERLARVADLDPELLVTDFADPAAAAALANAEVLFSCWGCPPLTRQALERMPRLRVLVHAAGSVKSYMTAEAWRRGITATSAAAANAIPVAEFTLAAILFSGKRVHAAVHAYRSERAAVQLAARHPDVGNYRRTVGIVGASRIGRRVIALLEPFDVQVLVHDPFLGTAEAKELGADLVGLDDLVERSDVVSLHAPLLPETRGLFDAARLARMRDGATLINTARGSLVDTDALVTELVAGRLHAVLDHTEPEVLPADSPLYELPNALVTPHIAGSVGNELARMADSAIDEVERLALGRPFHHPVHEAQLSRTA
ncbi:hydroxyacid dehydrogenase [Mangrovactinospora gilvigrisea]|uniref:Hydroxyacid dehydrogenase n=2 Tax=Mangrovactinospora gilvigrisea TaxID=1428644 RepID=A0A1J7CD81_9ACTN|nr:hydroxyacid dehydrogenase [Mangrovactinospora gilvigrisea]